MTINHQNQKRISVEYHPPLLLTASIKSLTSEAVRWSREILQLSVLGAAKVVITHLSLIARLTSIVEKARRIEIATFAVSS
jgi:hypothetical protein